jgi:hypothetical protein
MTFNVTHWDTLMIILRFSMQGKHIVEHTSGKYHVFTF